MKYFLIFIFWTFVSTLVFAFIYSYVSLSILLFTISLVLLFNFIVFKKAINCVFHKKLIFILLGIFAGYLLILIDHNALKSVHCLSVQELIFSLIVVLLIIMQLLVDHFCKKTSFSKKSDYLFKEREYDLKRLTTLLKEYNIVGINSQWGDGKTFLVDWYCNNTSDGKNYFVKKIEVLSYNFNEYDKVVFEGIADILRENGIFVNYFSGFQHVAEENFWSHLVSKFLIGTTENKSEIIKDLVQKVSSLDKKILIIFEDIDRVKDAEVVKRIFSIGNILASFGIKVIYEYSNDELEKKGISVLFKEKYIPIEMNLTPLCFKDLVTKLFADPATKENLSKFNKKELAAIKKAILKLDHRRFRPIAADPSIGVIMSGFAVYSVRGMINFLRELLWYLDYHRKLDSQGMDTVVSFCFIKNLFSQIYNKFDVAKTLEETFKFKINVIDKKSQDEIEKTFTLKELNEYFNANPDEKEHIDKELDDVKNEEARFVFNIIDYPIDDYRYYSERYPNSYTTVQKQSILIGQNKREAINRLIFNLLASGRSELSDYKAIALKFVAQVLNSQENQEENFDKFLQNCCEEAIYKDNKTTLLVGEDPNYFVA